MEQERVAGFAGITAAVFVLILGSVPYLLGSPAAVSVYYTGAPVGPPMVALFAILEVIVLLAGLRRRSDPATVAGIAVVLGLFAAVIAWWWAFTIEAALAGGVTQFDLFRNHRWAIAGAASLQAIASLMYGNAVLR